MKRGAPGDAPMSVDERVRSFLYLCPACGAFVRADAAKCDKCGASLHEDEPTLPSPPKEPEMPVLRRCAECAATVPPDQATCGVCGTPFIGASAGPEPVSAPSAPLAIAKEEEIGDLEQPREEEPSSEPVPEPAVESVPEQSPPVREAVAKTRAKEAVPRHRTPIPSATSALAPWREFAARVTGLAIPAAAFAVALGAPGHEWSQLFVSGVLFGIGLGLTISELRPVARSLPFLLWVVGTALLLATPLAALAGSPLATPAAVTLLAAGGALDAFAAWRLPRGVGVYLPWLSGLSLLTIAASVPIALLTFGDPAAEAFLWLAGGALTVGPAILLGRKRRWTVAAAGALADAESALSRREYAKALRLYDKTLDLSGRLGQSLDAAHYGKGAALVAVGQLDDALAVLDRALSSNPRNEVAWVNKGTALTRMGRLQDALKCYNSAIKVNARYEVAWNNKGNALSRLGKNEWALQCYDQALSLDPSYRVAWVNKGYVLARLGRFDEAANCADRALQLTAGASA